MHGPRDIVLGHSSGLFYRHAVKTIFDKKLGGNTLIMFQYFRKDWKNAIMDLPLPKEATLSEAGSAGKIKVMRSRLEQGEHLHHENDEVRKTDARESEYLE